MRNVMDVHKQRRVAVARSVSKQPHNLEPRA